MLPATVVGLGLGDMDGSISVLRVITRELITVVGNLAAASAGESLALKGSDR